MTGRDADELWMLRQRAYGPSADIHLDPEAAQRLRHLEDGERRSTSTVAAGPAEETDPASLGDIPDPSLPVLDADRPPATERRRLRFHVRPLTVVILVVVAVLLMTAWLAVTLVQRVQISPLQPAATQVARLSQDDGYHIPASFAGGPAGSGDGQAYQDFYGLRTVVNGYAFTNDATEDDCIVVYPSERVTDTAPNSFSGPAYFGCGAGAFPAAVTFRITAELPQQLRDAYPVGTALQFVLDEHLHEVVVFEDHE